MTPVPQDAPQLWAGAEPVSREVALTLVKGAAEKEQKNMAFGAFMKWEKAGALYRKCPEGHNKFIRQAILALLCFALIVSRGGIAQADELFLCRNTVIKEPIDLQQIRRLQNEETRRFRPGNRITAVYTLQMSGKEDRIEFRWMRSLDGRNLILHESYLHRIHQNKPGEPYIAYAWLILDPSLFDKMLGSKYAGDWYVQIYVNDRKVQEKHFTVSYD